MTTLDLEATIRELVDQRDALDALLRFGATVPPMKGIEEIARILTTLEPLHTTHTVTNPRVEVDGDTAQLFALVEAQHVRRDDPQRHLLLKNVYWAELSRAGARWVIDAMTIDNVWYDGDPAVLFG